MSVQSTSSEWQPIATAPKDGTPILGYNPLMGHLGVLAFDGLEWELLDPLGGKRLGIGFYPILWISIPEPVSV